MRADPVLAAVTLPVGDPRNPERVPLYFAAEGGLHYLRGNAAPYFALTYTSHRSGHPRQLESGGAGHERIAEVFPGRFDDLAALHLSTIDGVPMHAEANGWYWMAGALGGAGEQYHGGNADRQHWRDVDGVRTFDGYRHSTPDECLATFADHARITVEEAAALRDELRDEHANNPDGWTAARATLALRLDDMRPRWKAEALAAIERHGLRVYGDPWTPPTDPAGALIEEAAAGDPGEANEPPLHAAAVLTGGNVPAHYDGAYPRLSCCGGPVELVEAVQR